MSAKHVGIGTDLDGGYGTEQTPMDLDSIADLQSLSGLLSARGYSTQDVEGILHGNFIEFLRRIVDGEVEPVEAVKAYHAVLEKLGVKPQRRLPQDLQLTATSRSYRR